jgi:hypothetical protein
VDVPRIAWSPDGKWLAAGLKPEGGKDSAINLISVETGEKRPLTQPPSTFSDSACILTKRTTNHFYTRQHQHRQ